MGYLGRSGGKKTQFSQIFLGYIMFLFFFFLGGGGGGVGVDKSPRLSPVEKQVHMLNRSKFWKINWGLTYLDGLRYHNAL